jgi:hypothetical protein
MDTDTAIPEDRAPDCGPTKRLTLTAIDKGCGGGADDMDGIELVDPSVRTLFFLARELNVSTLSESHL